MLFWVLVVGIPFSIVSIAALPLYNTAHAGVLSFLAGMLGDKASASSSDGKYNSQNLALLDAQNGQSLAVGGGEISIVDSSALEYQAETADAYQSDQISVYVVRDGDTLSQIAKMFNVSVNTIVWANDISNGVIAPGQTLIILPVSGIKHVVKAGDTVQSIAKQHNGDLKEILQFNNLTEDAKLTVGDEIIIPNGDATPSGSTLGSTTKPTGSTGSTKPSAAGYYIKPFARSCVLTQGIHGYNAVDLAVPLNTKILASAAGKVIVSKNNGGYNGGYGNYIVIAHPNGTQTLYAHLTSTIVNQGASVAQGQAIAYSGSTGRSTGPHLHFEVRSATNPGVNFCK